MLQTSVDATEGSEHDALFGGVSKETAAEILKQAQAVVAAQHAAGAAVDSKLATVLGQGVAISTAALGAATLPLASTGWMPGWAGIGLLVAGVCAAGGALTAWFGLRPREWAAPGLSPQKVALPSVLASKPQTAMMLMAWSYQDGAEENRRIAVGPSRALRFALGLLIASPAAGSFAAGSAWTWIAVRQPSSAPPNLSVPAVPRPSAPAGVPNRRDSP